MVNTNNEINGNPHATTQNHYCVEGHWSGQAPASPGPLSCLELERLAVACVLFSLSSSSFQRSDPPISPLLPIASVAYRDFPYYMQPSVKFIPTLGFDCFSPKNYLITKILHTKWDPASSIFFFLGENKGVREVIDTCKVILFLCYSSSEDHNQKENAMCVCTTHHHHHSYSKMPFSFFSMVRHAFHQALCKVYHTCVYLTFF